MKLINYSQRKCSTVCKVSKTENKNHYKSELLENLSENERQYIKEMENELDNTKNWQWLQAGTIKKETKELIFATQEQALEMEGKSRIQNVSKQQYMQSP